MSLQTQWLQQYNSSEQPKVPNEYLIEKFLSLRQTSGKKLASKAWIYEVVFSIFLKPELTPLSAVLVLKRLHRKF